jgi:hypothetical protein
MAEIGCLRDIACENLEIQTLVSSNSQSTTRNYNTINIKGRLDTLDRIEFFDNFFEPAPNTGAVSKIALANGDFVQNDDDSAFTIVEQLAWMNVQTKIVANTTNWLLTGSDDDFILTTKNLAGGVWELETDANANDQLNLFGQKQFTLASGKDLYFKARFKIVSTAAEAQGFFIGLTSNNTVNFIDDGNTAYDDGTSQSTYGFLRPDNAGDDLNYKVITQNATTLDLGDTTTGEGASLSGTAAAVITNWCTAEIIINDIGAADATHFKVTYNLTDETTGTTHTYSINGATADLAYASQVVMCPAICIKSGGAKVEYDIDYVYVSQAR